VRGPSGHGWRSVNSGFATTTDPALAAVCAGHPGISLGLLRIAHLAGMYTRAQRRFGDQVPAPAPSHRTTQIAALWSRHADRIDQTADQTRDQIQWLAS